MHLRGTRDRIGVRISFVRVLEEENYKYNIGNPHRQHLQSFPDNQPCQWSIQLKEHSVRRALKSRARTERSHVGSSWYVLREALGMKKKSAKLKKQGGERLENFGSGKIFGLLLVQIWGKQELSWWGEYLLRCSERKSVWPRYHGSKISGGVCSFSSPEPLGLICNGLWGREWSLLNLLRFSQTRAASFPVVLGDFGCDVPCQNTWTLKFKNERWNTETHKTDRNLACVQTPPPPLRKNRRRGPFSNFSWGEGGLYTG